MLLLRQTGLNVPFASKTKQSLYGVPQIPSARVMLDQGYKTLAGNITKFRDLDCMPIQVDLSRLDEGEGLENTFVRWKARWHKSCYDLFNSTKLKRAEKRQALESEQPVGGKYTRSASPASFDNCGTCFF